MLLMARMIVIENEPQTWSGQNPFEIDEVVYPFRVVIVRYG